MISIDDILRTAFYEEAEEMFEEIENCLLDMESQGVTKDKIDNLFRYMHTLKGSSSAMGVDDMAKLTHHLEDVLGMVRGQTLELSRAMINQMFLSLDDLKMRISAHKEDRDYEIDVAKHIEALKNAEKAEEQNPTQEPMEKVLEEKEKDYILENLGLEDRAYKITIKLSEDSQLKGARLYIITHKLEKLGQVYKSSWENKEVEKIQGEEFQLIFITSHLKKEITDVIFTISEIKDVRIEDISLDDLGAQKEEQSEELQTVIRVNINKLDQLLKLVEELSVDKERLNKLAKELFQKYTKDPAIKTLCSLIQQIDFIGNEMQESVMSTRMYTLDNVFRRFPRMIRDLSIKQDKEIQLKIEGENTELDRSIMEKIIDPLTHIIRNSVDHGIETTGDRIKAGKEARGTIKLSAGQEQGYIFVKIQDDGKGMNLDEIKDKAITKGLISNEKAQLLSEKEILELVFMPGFSTAGKVTNVSGRGVGMNVVKENVEKINGIIDVENVEGEGFSITLKLPLTLAIIQSLLIQESNYRFALPLLSILEIFKIKETSYEKDIKFVNGREVINWRGEVLPIIRVSELFNIPKSINQNTFIAIVLGFSTTKIVLGVEKVIGQQQIVIKSLDDFKGKDNVLGELKGISGTAILGDGDFAYVPDMQILIREMTKKLSST